MESPNLKRKNPESEETQESKLSKYLSSFHWINDDLMDNVQYQDFIEQEAIISNRISHLTRNNLLDLSYSPTLPFKDKIPPSFTDAVEKEMLYISDAMHVMLLLLT